MDNNIINELAGKLADAVPGDLNELRNDIESNFRTLLQNGLDKLDLVTREEFDVQRDTIGASDSNTKTTAKDQHNADKA